MNALRKGMPPLPARMKKLPISEKGYPIPWFVSTLEDGSRDFRLADGRKRVEAVEKKLCWLCGEKLGRYMAFVIGPMCAVNRNTSEPPCHLHCAEFAVQACPFLILPQAKYRDANLPEPDKITSLPHSIPGNPGACAIWVTESYRPYPVEGGNWLISIGPATEVSWWAEGHPATRQQILDSMNMRLPALQELANKDGPEAIFALGRAVGETLKLLPA